MTEDTPSQNGPTTWFGWLFVFSGIALLMATCTTRFAVLKYGADKPDPTTGRIHCIKFKGECNDYVTAGLARIDHWLLIGFCILIGIMFVAVAVKVITKRNVL